ncbi:MAG: hypothetical protein GWN00_21230 [Aliifodinibius sp.]|nr:hypothetical protein [Fodinibius sp.]NIY27238.1 hypothetical protein [Fodinibius sp.]
MSEAIAHGVPAVVAPNVGASEEIMETGAGLVSLEDTLDRFVEVVSSAMKMDTYLDLRNNAIVAPIRMMSTWARELVNSVENEWRKRC